MSTPGSTLKFTDPSGSQNAEQDEHDQKLRRARIFLAIYYVVLPIVLIFLLFKVFPNYPWPTVSKESNELVNNIPIYFFGKAVATSLEDRLLLLVIVAGALGSYIHSATSYSDFRGNRQFSTSWTLWYALRPMIGVSLAVILYFVTRGGLLLMTNGGDATTAKNINPFGVAAVAGLTGMFSKVAADKLAEVFTTLFKSQGDQSRRDSLAPAPAPEIKDLDKKTGPIAGGDTVTITGSGFASGAKVSFDNVYATNVTVVNDTTVTAVTPAGSGTVDVVILNPDGQSATATAAYTYTDGDSPDKAAATPAPVAGEGSGDQDAIDGCDVPLKADTSDEDLPITQGGVKD